MLRFVEIKSVASYRIQVGDKTIAPKSSLVMSYDDYLDIIVGYDLSGLPISISSYDVELRQASVSDFGAKGDGIADDTQAIQAAIDYMEGFGGGIVEVPVGVYSVSKLTIDGNVGLSGQGKDHTVIKQQGGEMAAVISVSNSSSKIEGMTIEGAR